MQFYKEPTSKVLEFLKTDVKTGLTDAKVTSRKQIYGENVLEQKKKISPLVIFFNQFRSFIIYILLFAVIVSLLAQEYVDSIVILSILVFNALFGFIQEYRAEKAIEALKKLSALKARVRRNGDVIMIDTKDVVPGDILVLEEGDKIPADARIIESVSLQTLEASLTGESTPVSKISDLLKGDLTIADRKNMVFAGTAITKGRGVAVVVETAMKTQIGKIAGMINEAPDKMTPLQKKLEAFGKWVGILTLLICAGIFLTGIIKDGIISLLFAGEFIAFIVAAKEWFLTAIALAVAAVPEGLPAIVTISLALGVRRMIQRNALIRKLPSVETLGETTVICSDKTGTLTKNEMTVRKAMYDMQDISVSGEGYATQGSIIMNKKEIPEHAKMLFKCGVLCNNATLDKGKATITGDPTEAALLVSAEKAGFDHAKMIAEWKRTHEEPFDSNRKMMSTVVVDPKSKKSFVFTKGAPESVLERCDSMLVGGKVRKLTPKQKEAILAKNTEFASKALRVLAFAYKEYRKTGGIESKLVFIGLQGMIDPPRPEVKESVARCKTAGIRAIMITGDNINTAQAIAHEIGIEGEAINGVDFNKLTPNEQYRLVRKISIFARVEPQHKMRIVELLQRNGEVVAMTGDGVNDAPALKKADMGVAMGIKGTDVSKEASDMVLQDDNFASIVNAVEEGRGIYQNIQKFVNYLLSSNLAEVLIIFFAIVFSMPLPMTAIMLLWLNLVTDGLPALALSVDTHSKNLMNKPPKKQTKIMDRSMMFNIIYVAVLITIAVLILFYWADAAYADLDEAMHLMKMQTIAFTALIVMEFARLQAIRSEYKIGTFSNKYLILAVAASLGLQLAVIYTPLASFFGTVALNLTDWLYIVGATIAVFILTMIGVKIKNKMKWFAE